jgi:hypothetical protein
MIFKFPKQQMLRQERDRDCSVSVFARLAGISEATLLQELPQACAGEVGHNQWIEWLKSKNIGVVEMHEGCPTDVVPCAHLLSEHQPRDERDFHWIYRDEDGDVHDPSPCFAAVPADDPGMRDLKSYPFKILTISVSRPRK